MESPVQTSFLDRWATSVSCCIVVLLASASAGQEAAGVVPITAEPDHKIRFDNGHVRIYEIYLPPGRGTLLHEHRADNFTVNFGDSEVTIEPPDGDPLTISVATGGVGFSSTATGPYTHRVVATGQTEFHGIAIELLARESARQSTPDRRQDPPFHVVLENERGRAYRIRLEPGESTGRFARQGSSVLVAMSAGRISQELDGEAPRLWDFEAGYFRWIDESGRPSVRNEGQEPADLVEIEIY